MYPAFTRAQLTLNLTATRASATRFRNVPPFTHGRPTRRPRKLYRYIRRDKSAVLRKYSAVNMVATNELDDCFSNYLSVPGSNDSSKTNAEVGRE